MRRLLLAGLAAAVTAVLAACGEDSGTGAGAPTPTATASATATPTATAGASRAGSDPLRGASRRIALLTDVRAARHEGFDRVVFEFRGARPGYDIRYVSRPLRQDGSGRRVPVAGAHVVRVRMEPALDADLSRPAAPATYTGPRRIRPETSEVVEVARVGGFEGVLTWAVGLGDRVAFRASTLADPARLVVDFRNR